MAFNPDEISAKNAMLMRQSNDTNDETSSPLIEVNEKKLLVNLHHCPKKNHKN